MLPCLSVCSFVLVFEGGRVLGPQHAATEAPFMMEVAARTDADKKGGHLAKDKKSGGLLLRESAQCPDEDEKAFQDVGKYKYFNTNNLWVDLVALKAPAGIGLEITRTATLSLAMGGQSRGESKPSSRQRLRCCPILQRSSPDLSPSDEFRSGVGKTIGARGRWGSWQFSAVAPLMYTHLGRRRGAAEAPLARRSGVAKAPLGWRPGDAPAPLGSLSAAPISRDGGWRTGAGSMHGFRGPPKPCASGLLRRLRCLAKRRRSARGGASGASRFLRSSRRWRSIGSEAPVDVLELDLTSHGSKTIGPPQLTGSPRRRVPSCWGSP